MEKYLDKNLSAKERAADLLKRMSLEEKMAQAAGILAQPHGAAGLLQALLFRHDVDDRVGRVLIEFCGVG